MNGRGYIGGAHVAAILGISPFTSRLDAYCEITGDMSREVSDQKDAEQQEFFWRRRALEPFANECFERKTGLRIVETNRRYDDDEFAWAKAEIDAEVSDTVYDHLGGHCNVETKTVRQELRDQWGDPRLGEEPPPYVTAQAMWGLSVTGRNLCFVHALIGLDESRVFEVERDDEFIALMRSKMASFWNHHVVPRVAPQPANENDLKRMFPRDSGQSVEATGEVLSYYSRAVQSAAKMRLAQADYERHTLELKLHMRHATMLTHHGNVIAKWKTDSRGVRPFKLI